MSADQVPREAKLVSLLLTSAGVPECEPKVIQQLLEFMFKYSTDVLQDSIVYGEHAGKSEIDLDDLKLAIQTQTNHMFISPPSKEILLELAARKNCVPLPLLDNKNGFRLPPDHQCLFAANYRITSLRNGPSIHRNAHSEIEDPAKRAKLM